MVNKNLKNFYKSFNWTSIFLSVIGVFLLAIGTAINFCANLGNDAVSVFFAGIRKKFNVSLGIVVYLMNTVAFLISLIFGRKNIGVGTIMYIIFTGRIIDLVVPFYNYLLPEQGLISRMVFAIIGSLVMIFGASLMVFSKAGADVWTAMAITIAEYFDKDFKKIKVTMDCIMCFCGFLLGGKVGVVTIAVSLFGAPLLKMIVKCLKRIKLSKNKI